VDVPLRDFGIPQQFLAHAKRGEVLADIGLTPAEIAGGIGGALTRMDVGVSVPAPARGETHARKDRQGAGER
jgi:1-deoxy-D-xylulose-5-phosphate synthase